MTFAEKAQLAKIAKLEQRIEALETALREMRASTRGRKPAWLKALGEAPENDAQQTAF